MPQAGPCPGRPRLRFCQPGPWARCHWLAWASGQANCVPRVNVAFGHTSHVGSACNLIPGSRTQFISTAAERRDRGTGPPGGAERDVFPSRGSALEVSVPGAGGFLKDVRPAFPLYFMTTLDCQSPNAAPVGSTRTLNQPISGTSVTSLITVAPRLLAFRVEAEMSSTRT